ncbi:MAG: response regulator [Gammaproteobacteria bacterium]
MNITEKEKILFVDDSATVRSTASKMLSERYEVIEATNGDDAWDILQHDDTIRIIFADIQMPVLNGLQLLSRIRKSSDENLSSLPVIMVTGESDSEATMRAVFEMGATDFIGKPFKAIDLQTRAYSYLKLTRKLRTLNQLSGQDKQTGAYNATQYKKLGSQALSFAMRHKIEFTVAHFEICDYQQIKLTHGDSIAAQILTTVASRLGSALRKEDIIARIGIARFGLILPCTSRVRSSALIMRMRDMIQNLAFDTGREQLRIKLAIGITCAGLETHADNFDEINLQAEQALTSASSRSGDSNEDTGTDKQPHIEKQKFQQGDDLLQCLQDIVEGKFSNIEKSQQIQILDSLNAFAEFVETSSLADARQVFGDS